jgi:hypothetical protein
LLYDESDATLVFASHSKDGRSIWGAVLEKAWAKMKGNYILANDGVSVNAIRALTGAPTFIIDPAELTADQLWVVLTANDAKGYIMSADTAGTTNTARNTCGLTQSHAFSIITTFEMTDVSNIVHRMLLMRNPWGLNQYTWKWRASDPNWTAALVGQVPYGFNPTSNPEQTGMFVTPVEAFDYNDDVGRCFSNF